MLITKNDLKCEEGSREFGVKKEAIGKNMGFFNF